MTTFADVKRRLFELTQQLTEENFASSERKIHDLLQFWQLQRELFPQEEIVPVGHLFKRTLRGGLLFTDKNGQPLKLSEGIIRQNDWQDGDYLTIVSTSPHTFQKVAPPAADYVSQRREITYALVEREGTAFFCAQQLVNGTWAPIIIHNAPHCFNLTDDDLARFNLQEGMLVAIAYYEDHIGQFKVCWAHSYQDDGPARPKLPKFYKEKHQRGHEQSDISQTFFAKFAGKKIVMVGAEDRFGDTIQQWERHGVTLACFHSTVTEERLSAAIKQADAVIVMLRLATHRGSHLANELAKQYGTPITNCDRTGIQAVQLSLIGTITERQTFDQRDAIEQLAAQFKLRSLDKK